MSTSTIGVPRTAGPARPPEIPSPPSAAEVLVAAAVAGALVACASRYGYHRDELYFLAAGRHPAWGYADQGPMAPLVARAMTALAPGSLTVLRLPSALAAAVTALVTGRLAAALGGGRRACLLAVVAGALAPLVLFTGHTLSTSTFDLLTWTLTSWLVVRAVRTGRDRWWVLVGVVLGVGLLNKPLPAFLAVALLAGVVISGPRWVLRRPALWCGAAVALGLWLPWLVWQAHHGWPEWAVSRSIAAGGSTSSQPRWALLPFQLLLAGPLLAPVWLAGLVRLLRDPALRFLGWAWLLLAGTFLVTGGKPYYLAGLLPLLIGAGAAPVTAWLEQRSAPGRALLAAAVGGSVLTGAIVALPVLPVSWTAPVVAVNPDVGETIGWPALVGTVARAADRLPAGETAVIFTANYGEAGAIDRFGPTWGLPSAYSGHNAYAAWGPPPDTTAPVITVGLAPATLAARFRGCHVVAVLHSPDGLHTLEDGSRIAVCRGPVRPWSEEWPYLRHLG